MKTISRKVLIHSSPDKVFKMIDDLGVTGMHMTKSSAMIMGSKLNLEYLTTNHTGLGSKYRWTGTMMGMKMDFTVQVTKWVEGVEKIWETIGEAKMIIYSWYRMHLLVYPEGNTTQAELSITYEKPRRWFGKIISFFFADWYCNWCLKNMLGDTKKNIEFSKNSRKTFFMKLIALKFGLALGIALSISFLICNVIFSIGGKEFSLSIVNSIFHDMDFKPLMTDGGFNFLKLIGGMVVLFLEGLFVGYVTSVFYNIMNKRQSG